ncbi:MAG: cobalamin B12-binding domain-containing protein [Acetobacteraceae bacterium]|nr:cobalamin B12-binding domain-containing protein [Acetobacteraceae bacterium]
MLSSDAALADTDDTGFLPSVQPRALLDLLARTLDRQVLPQVAAALPQSPAWPTLARLTAERLVAGQDGALAAAVEEAKRQDGKPEHICLTLLTDIARELGQLWSEDRCSFVDVTLGVMQAQEALLALAPRFATQPNLARGRSALLGAAPGDQHGFGIAMVGEFFRQAGWLVVAAPQDGAEAWERAVSGHWFDVAGISLAGEDGLAAVGSLIARLRRHSRNPTLAVMVGGPFFARHPQRAAEVQADATAADAADAVRQAAALLRLSVAQA